MAKYPDEKEKINEIKEFIELTWEAVRRNPDYKNDYLRFLHNHGLSPEDIKEKTNPDGSKKGVCHPGLSRKAIFNPGKGRFIWEEEAPDPNKCNLSFMLHRWGFACDPDEATPQVASWSSIFSKEWRKRMKSKGLFFSPVIHAERNFKELPGVLKVNQFPDVRLEHKGITSFHGEEKGRLCEIKSHAGITVLFGPEKIEDRPKLTMPNGANLTVTINLQAPSKLIRYALETLIDTCKAELEIPDRRIEANYIRKCFQIHDFVNEGYSPEEIAQSVKLNHYKKDEAEKDKDRGCYVEFWGGPQIERCLKDAEQWIIKGSII